MLAAICKNRESCTVPEPPKQSRGAMQWIKPEKKEENGAGSVPDLAREAQELERLILKSSDAISHCVLVGTCADRARLARRPSQSCMTQLFARSRGGHPS